MRDELKEFEKRILQIIDAFTREVASVRTNRPSASLIEDIRVNYYGESVPIKHVGSIGLTPPRELHIQVWDKNAINLITKAIEESSLNITPQVDGMIVRVFLPELSEERRKEFIRHVKKLAEEFRIEIRRQRDEIMKKIDRDNEQGNITEDDRFREREDAQKFVEKGNNEIERIVNAKVKDIGE